MALDVDFKIIIWQQKILKARTEDEDRKKRERERDAKNLYFVWSADNNKKSMFCVHLPHTLSYLFVFVRLSICCIPHAIPNGISRYTKLSWQRESACVVNMKLHNY